MHKLECKLQDSPGALERYLRVIRVRGYELLQIQADNTHTHLHLELVLGRGRGLQQLLAQLHKLEGTISILSVEPNPVARQCGNVESG